jgi:hypothetical protein
MHRIALCHHIPGATLTLTTLGGHAEFELDVVKAHTCPHVTRDIAIRNSVADTDNHGGAGIWLAVEDVQL